MFRKAYSDRAAGFWRFYCDVKIFGCLDLASARERLGWLWSALGVARPGVLTDEGVRDCGFFPTLTAGLEAPVFSVGADCAAEPIRRAVAQARAEGMDGLLAIGGGSVLDAAKLVAAAVRNDLSLASLIERESLDQPPLPLIAVPTTFGTGSEANMIGHLTSPEGKRSLRRDWAAPAAALLIGEIARFTPENVRLLAAVDAWVHAFESLTLAREVSPVQQALCRQTIAMQRRHWPSWLEARPSDECGLAMASAACMAGLAINNARTGLIHALAAPFAERFRLPHAVSLLPFIEPAIAFNWSELKPHFAGETLETFIAELNRTLLARREALLKPWPFRVATADIEWMAEQCLRDSVLLKENPAPLRPEDFAALYRRALRDRLV